MEGTLVDSTKGVVGAWHVFKQTYPHLDVEEILNSVYSNNVLPHHYTKTRQPVASHGVRTVENLRIHCGITDSDELEVSYLRYALQSGTELVNLGRLKQLVSSSRLSGVQN